MFSHIFSEELSLVFAKHYALHTTDRTLPVKDGHAQEKIPLKNFLRTYAAATSLSFEMFLTRQHCLRISVVGIGEHY